MRPSSVLVVAFTVLAAMPFSARAQDHIYNLNGVYTDANAGPSLSPLGGTIAANGFSFAQNDGLSLTGVLGSTYTIAMRFRFDDISGFRRIVDFKDRASDTGPYVLSGNANFYNIMTGVNPIYAQNQLALSLFTRDASGIFSAYVGGVLQYTFSDVSNLATVAVNTVRFFQDDTAVGGEASAGLVNYIATWNRALTAEQVRLFDPTGGNTIVPEPATIALFAAGLLCVAAAKRRYWFNA